MTDRSDREVRKNPAGAHDAARRRFMQGLAASAAVALAPGVTLIAAPAPAAARPAGQPASAKNRWAILIDTNQCGDDCGDCVTACRTENGWQGHNRPASDVQWIRAVKVRDPGTRATRTVPMMCQHCAKPACTDVCPTGASFKRADGIVLVDKHICIGCRYCMMACPYKARSFVHEDVTGQKPHAPRGKGTVEGCTLCVHRIDAGRTPACVEACSKGAMIFGDINDPSSAIATEAARHMVTRIRADLGLGPAMLYRGI